MANTIKLKRSSVAGKVPLTSDLDYGEVSINYTDGTLYYKDSSGSINTIGSNIGNTIVSGNITANTAGTRATFANVITTNGIFWANGDAYSSGGGGSFSGGIVTSTIYPNANVTLNLGTSTAFWGTTFTGNVVSNSMVTTDLVVNNKIDLRNVSVAIGVNAAVVSQDINSVAIGTCAATTNQHQQSVAIGYLAGQCTQNEQSIAIGSAAGNGNQGHNSIAIGDNSGNYYQGNISIAIGSQAGGANQHDCAVAIGHLAGFCTQGSSTVAIGSHAGNCTQGNIAVAIGKCAGHLAQGELSVAIGPYAGGCNQGFQAVAIGSCSGQISQGSYSVAVGHNAGCSCQGNSAVALGDNAAQSRQGNSAVALGNYAGYNCQGEYAVAIGSYAGQTSQVANSIAINTGTTALNPTNAGFYVNPVRNVTAANVVLYDPATKEFTYSDSISGNLGVTANLNVTGNIYSAGSRTLTSADLVTVTYTANYITMNPTLVTVPVVGTSTTYGTYNFGTVADIQTYADYNVIAQTGYFSANDAATTPAHIEYIGFTNVPDFNRLVLNINYTANSGHTQNIDLYNYNNDTWDTFGTYSGSGAWQNFVLGVIDSAPYISNTGNVTVRNDHVSPGNTSHRTWIDYVALEKSVTGGQGPRGPTGATGATGATGNGVATGGTTGQVLVKNSSTNYDTSWTTPYGNTNVALYLASETITSNIATTANLLVGNVQTTGKVYVGDLTNAVPYVMGTGAFHVAGGMSIAKDLWMGGNLYVANIISETSTILEVNDPLVFLRADSPTYNYDIGIFSQFINPDNGLNNYTGSIRSYIHNYWGFFSNVTAKPVSGTVDFADPGIVWDTIKVGEIIVGNGTPSTSYASGALRVAGGAGIGGNVNIGGNLLVVGNFTVQGNTITIGSNNITVSDSIIDLHTEPDLATLITDDGRDIGFRFHYYKGSDTHAFLGWENDAETLIYLQRSTEVNSNISGTPGNVKFGSLLLSNTTTSTSTATGALVVNGGAGIAGALYIANTGDVSANIGAYQVFANANAVTQATSIDTINANIGAYQTYANANVVAIQANLGAYQTYANANVAAIQANIGAYQTYANANVVAIQANLGAYQTYANANAATQATSIDTINANLGVVKTDITSIVTNANTNVAAYLTTATISTTGNVTAGNLTTTGNITGANVISANTFFVSTGIRWSGNGAAFASGGATFTASASAPSSPVTGDQWYKTTTNILYEYVTDGTTSFWLDVQSPVVTANVPAGATSLVIQDEGGSLVTTTNTINFVGAGVSATNSGNVVTVTIPGTSSAANVLTIRDEGITLVSTANAINFVGAGVTATNSGNIVTVTIPGTSSAANVLTVQDEGSSLVTTANTINFVGAGVTATNSGNVVTVTIETLSPFLLMGA